MTSYQFDDANINAGNNKRGVKTNIHMSKITTLVICTHSSLGNRFHPNEGLTIHVSNDSTFDITLLLKWWQVFAKFSWGRVVTTTRKVLPGDRSINNYNKHA